jgi:ParB family chromosome partitioning protein
VDLFFPEARKTASVVTPPSQVGNSPSPASEKPAKPAAGGTKQATSKETNGRAKAPASGTRKSAPTPKATRAAGVQVKAADHDGDAGGDTAPGSDIRQTLPSDDNEIVATSDLSQEVELVEVPGVRFAEIPVKDIHPNRKQPRSVFDEDDMAELVHSVREIGVLQPIVVRTSTEKGGEPYELVMGERRWRAVQAAGLATIPAIVRDTTDDDLLRDALLENLHRSQLNPLEEAAAYQQLLEDFGTTHEQLADRIGRSRPQVSNTLRLLKLPPLVQRRVAASVISAGHARALLALPDAAAMERLAQKIVAEGMSVRATEEAVTLYQAPASPTKNNVPRPGARHERLDYLASSLSDRLDTNVKISLGARKGRVSIEFASVEDLNRIMDVLAPNSDN